MGVCVCGKESSRGSKEERKNSLSIAICSCGPKRAKRAALASSRGCGNGKARGGKRGVESGRHHGPSGCEVRLLCLQCVHIHSLRKLYIVFFGPPISIHNFFFALLATKTIISQRKKREAAKFSTPQKERKGKNHATHPTPPSQYLLQKNIARCDLSLNLATFVEPLLRRGGVGFAAVW